MRYMKYIVFETLSGSEHVCIFNSSIVHSEFALNFSSWKPIRAGMVNICNGNIKCYGEAFSLKLQSDRVRDTDLISRMINDDI